MTTDTTASPRSKGAGILVAAGIFCLVVGLAAAVVGGISSGSDAAAGALVATVLVLVVFGGGAALVHLVAGVLPSASLLIALLTYTLQLVVMAVVLIAISRSELLDGTLDRAWLGGTVIVGTLAWLTCQVVVATRVRMPAYDLREPGAQ